MKTKEKIRNLTGRYYRCPHCTGKMKINEVRVFEKDSGGYHRNQFLAFYFGCVECGEPTIRTISKRDLNQIMLNHFFYEKKDPRTEYWKLFSKIINDWQYLIPEEEQERYRKVYNDLFRSFYSKYKRGQKIIYEKRI